MPVADPEDPSADGSSTTDAAPPIVGGSRRTAFRGGAWSAAATVLPMGGTLALSVVISRELGADVLGEQSLIAYVASMLFSVVIYSCTVASVQLLASSAGAGEDVRRAHLARWSFGAHLTGGVVAAAVLLSAGLSRDDYRALWFIAAVTAVVDAVGWAFASRDIARRGWAPTASRRLLAQAVSPVLAIACVYAGLGIEGVFAAQLAVAVVLLGFLSRLGRGDERVPTRGTPAPPWLPVLRLWGMFAISYLIIQIVERRLELVFLDRYHDAATVAMYSVAFNVVGIPLMLCASLIAASMPAIAARYAREREAVVDSLSRATRVVLAVNLLLAAGTISIGPGLVTLAYGPEFADGAALVPWLGLTLVLAPLGNLCVAFWSGTGRLRPVLLSGAVGAVVDIGLCLLLVPSLAEVGAVIATVSAQTTTAVLIISHTARQGLRLHLHPRRLLAGAGVAASAGLAAAGCERVVPGLWGTLVAIVAFCVVAALGARYVGLLDRADTEWLAGTLPHKAETVVRRFSPHRRPA